MEPSVTENSSDDGEKDQTKEEKEEKIIRLDQLDRNKLGDQSGVIDLESGELTFLQARAIRK